MSQKNRSRYERLQDQIEAAFARWGKLSYRYAWLVIISVVLLLAGMSTRLDQAKTDFSTESYLHEDDPLRETYNQFREDFSRDDKIAILVETNSNLVNPAFFRKLQAFHEALEKVPQVDSIDSLINARLTLGKQDELIVKELLEDWPETDDDWQALERRILDNPVYRKHFVDETLTKTVVIVNPDTFSAAWLDNQSDTPLDEFDFDAGFDSGFDDFDVAEPDASESTDDSTEVAEKYLTGEEVSQIIWAIEDIQAEFEAEDFKIGMSGSPVMVHLLNHQLGKDMGVLSGLGICLISLLLLIIYRRLVMVILPITVASLAMYLTIAELTFFGITLNSSVQILPTLLLAIGVGNSVHILNSFWQGIDQGLDKPDALSYSLGHAGLAVVMTGLTTAGGLMSFMSAEIKTVADMGLVAPLGIINALFFSMVLLPALIAVVPMRNKGEQDDSNAISQRFLQWCARVSTSNPKRMVMIWGVLVAIGLGMTSQINISHYPLGWFPPDEPFRHSSEVMDEAFRGTTYAEIVVDTGQENGLHDPRLLHTVQRAIEFVEQLEVNGVSMGSPSSMLDINRELHRALNGNDPEFYTIPDDRNLIAQELLLFENSGSDDLEDIVDTQFSKMRITMKTPNMDGVQYPEYLTAMKSGFREIIHETMGESVEVTYTGIMTMLGGVAALLISSTITAYLIAFFVIGFLMILLVGSVRTGLIAMIPNVTPIILTLGLMPILGIPLDGFTLLVGSIALGLAVDDTIHFMHNYQRFYVKFGDAPKAVSETLRTTGRALLFTTLALTAGFLCNAASSMSVLTNFGILTAFCIAMAFLADVLLAPALVTLIAQMKEKEKKEITA